MCSEYVTDAWSIERGDECTKDCDKGPEARRVGVCMREKRFKDREVGGVLGPEEGAGGTNGVTIARR